MQPTRRADRPPGRRPGRQCSDEVLPALAVAPPEQAQVAVVRSRGHEVGQDVLVEPVAAEVGVALGPAKVVEQAGRREHPAQPQRGRERLADAAEQGDVTVVQALQALGRQDDPGRVLVGRGAQHRADSGRRQRVDPQPAVVHRDVDDLEPEVPQQPPLQGVARVLHRDGPLAPSHQQLRDEGDALRRPGDHDHRVRIGHGAAHPREVVRELDAQRAGPPTARRSRGPTQVARSRCPGPHRATAVGERRTGRACPA